MHAYIHACKHAHNARARRRPVTFRCNRSPETGYIQMKPVALMLAFMHAMRAPGGDRLHLHVTGRRLVRALRARDKAGRRGGAFKYI